MDQSREELVQEVFEKFGNVFKRIYSGNQIGGFGRHGIFGHTAHHHDLRERKRFFEDLGLSRKHIFFLLILARSKEGMSVKDIASFLHVSPGAVTQFIDMLIEKDLVERSEDPNDRRGIKVKLTENARSKFSNIRKGFMGGLTPYFSNFSEEELHQFINLLDKIGKSSENP